MEYRPWPVVLISILQFLTPFENVWISAWMSEMSTSEYLRVISQQSQPSELLIFFLLPILMAIAVYSIKNWSLPILLIAVTWAIFETVRSHIQSPEILSMQSLIAIILFDLTAASYFFLPPVRKLYFDPRHRWWESYPRFGCNFNFKAPEKSAGGKILNISKGGMFITAPTNSLKLGDQTQFELQFSGSSTQIIGKVVHNTPTHETQGMGIQFIQPSAEFSDQLNLILKSLREEKHQVRPRPRNAALDFMDWLKTLLTTGKGLFPA